ncbi:hypothetical protein Q7P37_002212 [Cladosporium fusiforme]
MERRELAQQHLLGEEPDTWTQEQKALDIDIQAYIERASVLNISDRLKIAAEIRQIHEKYPSVVADNSLRNDQREDEGLLSEDDVTESPDDTRSESYSISPLSLEDELSNIEITKKPATKGASIWTHANYLSRVGGLRRKLYANNVRLQEGKQARSYYIKKIRYGRPVPENREPLVDEMIEVVKRQVLLGKSLRKLKDKDKSAEAKASLPTLELLHESVDLTPEVLSENVDNYFSKLKVVSQGVAGALEQQGNPSSPASNPNNASINAPSPFIETPPLTKQASQQRSNEIRSSSSLLSQNDKVVIRLDLPGKDSRRMYWDRDQTRLAFFSAVKDLFRVEAVDSVKIYIKTDNYIIEPSGSGSEWEMMQQDLLDSDSTKIHADVQGPTGERMPEMAASTSNSAQPHLFLFLLLFSLTLAPRRPAWIFFMNLLPATPGLFIVGPIFLRRDESDTRPCISRSDSFMMKWVVCDVTSLQPPPDLSAKATVWAELIYLGGRPPSADVLFGQDAYDLRVLSIEEDLRWITTNDLSLLSLHSIMSIVVESLSLALCRVPNPRSHHRKSSRAQGQQGYPS